MKRVFLSLVLILLVAVQVQAEPLRTAAGAGYKNLVEKWAQLYEQQTGNQVERVYGNMGQIVAQINHGGGICLAVGDKQMLMTRQLPISRFVAIGQGHPVLVSRVGLQLTSVADLNGPEYSRISAPDYEKAIYGRAAQQVLQAGGYTDAEAKVIQAGTVPRSGAYAISGEVDAAFVNKSYATANSDKFGSLLELKEGFSPIEIVVGVIEGCETSADVAAFIALLETEAMKTEIAAAGL
jgi:molybdate transport system substrate-binding protein